MISYISWFVFQFLILKSIFHHHSLFNWVYYLALAPQQLLVATPGFPQNKAYFFILSVINRNSCLYFNLFIGFLLSLMLTALCDILFLYKHLLIWLANICLYFFKAPPFSKIANLSLHTDTCNLTKHTPQTWNV